MLLQLQQQTIKPNSSYAQTQMKNTGARKQKNLRKDDLTTANEQKGDKSKMNKKNTETAETKKQQEPAIKCQEKEVESMISRHTHTKASSF